MDACKQSVIVTRFSLMISIGHSNYVTEKQARSLGLAIVEGSSFILRADDTTTLSPAGQGATRSVSFRTTAMARMSQCESIVNVEFRVSSNHTLVLILVCDDCSHSFDVQHMPEGCG